MNTSIHSKKNEARAKRLQQRNDAGFVATHYPDVASIVITMVYNQKDIQKSIPRIVNFFPGSYAVFRVDCLSRGCIDGGFDLTQLITRMIRNRSKTSKGELSCEGNDSSLYHSTIVYEVAIQYT